MSTAFNRRVGELQGRIAPVGAVPVIGAFVFCFGADVPGDVRRLAIGDQYRLEQSADVTALALVRFRCRVRGPASMPTLGLDLTQVGSVPEVAVAPFWVFEWGVGAAVQGARVLAPGRVLTVNDGAVDVSQLTGVQALHFTLRLGA